jgi:Zn-finger nucleic acid-binding protein
MKCPRCQKELKNAIFYNTGVDYCPKCLGIFFQEDELRQAKDEKDKDLRWLDVDLWQEPEKFKINYGKRLCPSCRLPLYEVYYGKSNIIVDICNVCKGIWLDRGEFRKIIDYLKKRAGYELMHEYVKDLNREFWEIFTGPETFREEVTDFLTILKVMNYKFLAQHPYLSRIISNLPR